jgi:hypothetical protein
MRSESANPETPDEIIAMITFAGSPELQEQLRSLCREYFDIFSTSVRSVPAQVDPMVIEIDRTKWEVPRNNLPPRHPHADQQTVEARRHRGIAGQRVEPSSPLPKGDGQWRLTLDFVQFSAATKGLEGWRLGTMKPTCFGLLDFTVGYHQTPRPCVMSTHRCYGTERSWPLLLEQYAEQGPQRTCLRNMRNIHRNMRNIQRALQRSSFANKLFRTVRNSTS